MRFDVRAVCAHPIVLALDEDTRLVFLSLLRESDGWGELDSGRALEIVSTTLAGIRSEQTRAAMLLRLHTIRLVHHDREGRKLCMWTPQALDDAAVFEDRVGWLAELETEVNGPIPGLTVEESMAL